MEKPNPHPSLILALAALACSSGCHAPLSPELTTRQQTELAATVAAYHLCVARTASVIEDGRSPVTLIAVIAVARCKPGARAVDSYLNRLALPSSWKAQYLSQVVETAKRQSAIMLRRGRSSGWQTDQAGEVTNPEKLAWSVRVACVIDCREQPDHNGVSWRNTVKRGIATC